MIKLFFKCMQIDSNEMMLDDLLDHLVGVCETPGMIWGGAMVGGATAFIQWKFFLSSL